MPVLTERRTSLLVADQGHPDDVGAVLKRAPDYLVAVLSGGSGGWYRVASQALTAPERELPLTMLQPAGFTDPSDVDELTVIAWHPLDEAADEW